MKTKTKPKFPKKTSESFIVFQMGTPEYLALERRVPIVRLVTSGNPLGNVVNEKAGGREKDAPKLRSKSWVATRLGVDKRMVSRKEQAGHMPKKIKIGGRVLFDDREIEDWVGAGCPKNWRKTHSR